MAHQVNNIDEFIGHRTGSGGRAGFLKNWHSNPGWIDVWLHTQCMPVVLYSHKFPKIVVKDANGVPSSLVFSVDYNCHESEALLKNQYRISDGKRDEPPQTCPLCRIQEVFRWWVFSGKMHWLQPVFEFRASDPSKNVVLRAGGMFNAYNDKKLTDAQKAEMTKYSVYQSEAWKTNPIPKAGYVFAVVDHNNVGGGVQVTTETSLLGDKVKTVIADARVALGEERGNPILHPYAIKWICNKSEQQFDKKYHAIRLETHQLNAQIHKLITTDPPDMSRRVRPFDPVKFRMFVEAHYVGPVPMPWDIIFENAKQVEGGEEPEGDFNTEEYDRQNAAEAAASAARPQASFIGGHPQQSFTAPLVAPSSPLQYPAAVGVAAASHDADLCACDQCGKAMRADAPSCPHCGFVYEVTQAPAAAAPPLPSRSGARPAPPPLQGVPVPTPPAPTAPMAPPLAREPIPTAGPKVDRGDVPFIRCDFMRSDW